MLKILGLILLLSGCTGTLERESRVGGRIGAKPASERCVELDERHASASAVAAGAGVLAGASGLATIPTGEIRDEGVRTTVRISLAITALLSGAVAYFATDTSTNAAKSWARECAGP